MHRRLRTLLLAGAALFAVPASAANVTLDGVPANKSGDFKITCTDLDNGPAQPCFVALSQGGAAASQSNPIPVADGADPAAPAIPNPGSGVRGWTASTAGSNKAIADATGTQADSAYGGTGNGSLVALNKGQYAILANLYASLGQTGDTAASATGAAGTQIALTKALRDKLNASLPASLGQKASAASLPVVIASDQSAIPATLPGVTGAAAPGTAATSALLAGGIYRATPPTLTDGQQAGLRLDASGALVTVPGSSGSQAVTEADGANVALGAKADTAYTGSGTASLIALAKGQYAALLAATPAAVSTTAPTYATGTTQPLSLTPAGALRTDGSATTQPVSSATLAQDATLTARLGTLGQKTAAASTPVVLPSDGTLPLPAGASTVANDNARAVYGTDLGPGAVSGVSTITGPTKDAGASPSAYPFFNATFAATQATTAIVQCGPDNSTWFEVYTGTVPAPTSGSTATFGSLSVSLKTTFRYCRTRAVTTTGTTTIAVASSLSTN